MALQEKPKPHPDTSVILRESARRLDGPTRRLFLRQAAGLGTLTLLGGCDVVRASPPRALARVRLQRPRSGLAVRSPSAGPAIPGERHHASFPFNAFYPEGQSPEVDPDSIGSNSPDRWRIGRHGPSTGFMPCPASRK